MSDVLQGLWNTTKYSTGEQIAVKPLHSLSAVYLVSRVHSENTPSPPPEKQTIINNNNNNKTLMKTYKEKHTLRAALPRPQTPAQVAATRFCSKTNQRHEKELVNGTVGENAFKSYLILQKMYLNPPLMRRSFWANGRNSSQRNKGDGKQC